MTILPGDPGDRESPHYHRRAFFRLNPAVCPPGTASECVFEEESGGQRRPHIYDLATIQPSGFVNSTPLLAGNRRGQVHLLRFCEVARHLCEEASKWVVFERSVVRAKSRINPAQSSVNTRRQGQRTFSSLPKNPYVSCDQLRCQAHLEMSPCFPG